MFFQIIILVVKIILSNTQQPFAQCGGKNINFLLDWTHIWKYKAKFFLKELALMESKVALLAISVTYKMIIILSV